MSFRMSHSIAASFRLFTLRGSLLRLRREQISSFRAFACVHDALHWLFPSDRRICYTSRRGTASVPSSAVVNTFREDKHANEQPVSMTNEDRARLENETDRLLGLLTDASQARSDRPNIAVDELSTVKLADFDRIFESWVHVAAMHDQGMQAAFRAHSLLQTLEANFERLDVPRDDSGTTDPIYVDLVPDAAIYNFVLQGYATSGGGIQAAREAELILDRMLERCRAYSPTKNRLVPPEPTARSFNIVMNAWAKTGTEDGAKRAEAKFIEMESWLLECRESDGPFQGAVPTARSLAATFDAWARSGVRGAEERVELMLNHMIEKCKSPLHNDGAVSSGTVIKVNRIVFHSAILAWVKSKRGQFAAEKAEELVRQMEDLNESSELVNSGENDEEDIGLSPDTRTLSLVMDAWANCPREEAEIAADRAQSILDRMENLYREGKDVKPNYVAFTTCIAARARYKTNDAARKVEELFHRLIKLYEESGDVDFRPTVVTGNAVISAWANSSHPDSVKRAEAVMNRLEQFGRPDLYSYNSMLQAYAQAGRDKEALSLLERLEGDADKDLPRPDTVSYNTVIGTLSKSRKRGNAEKALALLDRMEELSSRRENHNVVPDKITYTSVITAWSKSATQKQAAQAHQVLMRMLGGYKAGDKHLKPDAFACTATINACAKLNASPNEKKKALRMAIRIFELMKDSGDYEQPNELTFLAMMKASSNLASNRNEETRLLQNLFQQSIQSGLLSRQMLEHAQRRLPGDIQAKLGVSHGSTVPRHWSENARARSRP